MEAKQEQTAPPPSTGTGNPLYLLPKNFIECLENIGKSYIEEAKLNVKSIKDVKEPYWLMTLIGNKDIKTRSRSLIFLMQMSALYAEKYPDGYASFKNGTPINLDPAQKQFLCVIIATALFELSFLERITDSVGITGSSLAMLLHQALGITHSSDIPQELQAIIYSNAREYFAKTNSTELETFSQQAMLKKSDPALKSPICPDKLRSLKSFVISQDERINNNIREWVNLVASGISFVSVIPFLATGYVIGQCVANSGSLQPAQYKINLWLCSSLAALGIASPTMAMMITPLLLQEVIRQASGISVAYFVTELGRKLVFKSAQLTLTVVAVAAETGYTLVVDGFEWAMGTETALMNGFDLVTGQYCDLSKIKKGADLGNISASLLGNEQISSYSSAYTRNNSTVSFEEDEEEFSRATLAGA